MTEKDVLEKAQKLFDYPNTNGYELEEDDLLVFVDEKVEEEDLEEEEILPKVFEGYRVRVIETGVVETVGSDVKNRDLYVPVRQGGSIGQVRKRSAGTLGAIVSVNRIYVFESDEGDRVLVTKNIHSETKEYKEHAELLRVLGYEQIQERLVVGITNRHVAGERGTKIQHPSLIDKNIVRNIGQVLCSTPYSSGIDISVVQLEDDRLKMENVKSVNGVGVVDDTSFRKTVWFEKNALHKGKTVVKNGRTTGVTESEVFATNGYTRVEMNDGEKYTFKDTVMVENNGRSFVDGGDSGSALLIKKRDGEYKCVGFVFASSNRFSYAIPIEKVLESHGYLEI